MKWADFVVIGAKYNAAHTWLREVETLPDTGAWLGVISHSLTRHELLTALLRGATFATAYNQDGKWLKGRVIRMVEIGGERFLRTDGLSVRADDLGDLPTSTSRPTFLQNRKVVPFERRMSRS